jgi:PiT family inorganic phosphate transporter
MISVGVGAVSWGKVIAITLSWIVSPVAGALIAGSIYHFIQKKIMSSRDPHTAAVHYAPVLIFFVILILILSFIFKGLKNLHLELPFFHTLLLTIPLAALVSLFGRRWVRWQVHLKCELRPNPQGFSPVDCFFAQLQVLTACYVAFAHGANDVANAIGPLAAIFSVIKTKAVALQVEVPIWMLFIGGAAVGGGLFMYGGRIIATIGEKITEITPVRGFAAEFGAATTILICSRLGLPVSTTHVLVGSVVGVGLMRGMGVLDLRILKNIGASWLITVPLTMALSIILYKLVTFFFL